MKKFLYYLGILFFVIACSENEERETFWINKIFSSFEQGKMHNNTYSFTTSNDSVFLQTTLKQSSDFSFEGNHSIEIPPQTNTSLFTFENCKKDQLIEFSIWEKNSEKHGEVHIILYKNNRVETFNSNLTRKKSGWKQHYIEIPLLHDIDSLTVHVISNHATNYFDDFKLYIYPVQPKNKIQTRMELFLPVKSKLKLNDYLNNAIPKKIIPSTSKKYIKAFYLNEYGDSLPLKMKIKGDWTDHVQPHKPSFRIKLKNSAFLGMNKFSIQDVRTRIFIEEWIFHELAHKMDVLTTEYGFLNVSVNDYNYGLYAIEEHFHKRLLESKNRREGPILKFQEDSYWDLIKSRNAGETSGAYPFFESSMISAFSLGKIQENITLYHQYLDGAKLLAKFKNGDLDIEHIFDLDKLAKYYVLNELSGSDHGIHWHNRRFYFNPITQKLEHIFYDVLPNSANKVSIIEDILNRRDGESFESLDYAVLQSNAFQEYYFYYLEKYTKKEFLNEFKMSIEKDYQQYLSAIKEEYPHYNFQFDSIFSKAQYLFNKRNETRNLWTKTIKEAESIDFWISKRTYNKSSKSIFIPTIGLNTYISKKPTGVYKIQLENYHSNSITIVKLANRNKTKVIKDVVLEPYTDSFDKKMIEIDFKPDSIYYTLGNIPNKVFSQGLNQFPKPEGETTRMNLEEKWSPNSFNISDDTLYFSGKVTINKLILIPSKYVLKIEPGTSIEFVNEGGLIITNSLIAIGTEKDPITIFAKGNNSNGVTVLNGDTCILKHLNIDGLNSLNYKSWKLTGAVCLYETPCFLSNIKIANNHSEDALNIIRSHFEIKNITIKHTYSDGFDADFCTGNFTNSFFENTGNDCIDFSGSKVNIENIEIKNSGDKGVSAGEASTLILKNIRISGAISGIASKDGSIVEGENIYIENTESAATVFRKKINYPTAHMVIHDGKILNAQQNFLVEKGSSIEWNSKLMEGQEVLDIEEMYSIFEKK